MIKECTKITKKIETVNISRDKRFNRFIYIKKREFIRIYNKYTYV